MPLRNTLLAGAIFILLGAYVYFFELPKGDAGKSGQLLNFKADDVESLTLRYPDQEVQLKSDPSGKWKMTNPLQASADDSTVMRILTALSASEIKRTVVDEATPEDLKNFGLDKPKVKVSINLRRGGTLVSLLVGSKTPVGDSTYVKRETEPSVLLTDGQLSSSLERKLYDFRDKRIVDLKEEDVKQIALKSADKGFVLAKEGEEWFLDQPKSSIRADQVEVKRLLASLSNLFARDFIEGSDAEAKPYGLDRPRLRVTLDMGEKGGQREILFGSKREGKDEIYLTLDSGGTIYAVDGSSYDQINKPREDFLAKEKETPSAGAAKK